jgi:DNA-directed RNA polymerase subunit L
MPRSSDSAAPLSTFAQNLRAVIKHSELSVNAWAVKHKFTQSTINRIVTGKQDPTTAQVEAIAAKCGLFAWQMLVPNLDAQNPPVLREANKAESALYERLRQTIAELEELREQGNSGPMGLDDG